MTASAVFQGKRVLVTGHTGFKGTWLTLLLCKLGAKVSGFALPPPADPNMFSLTKASELLEHNLFADIRDKSALAGLLRECKPDLVVHMAAQPLVRQSYDQPKETWATNVMGTVNCLDAIRACSSVAAVLVVTTDKCYENLGWEWGYRETDHLGGHDPYSASKAAAELVVSSYRRSYFKNGPLVASARAGNVIGGGDWSHDRLIPDIARSVASKVELIVRNPEATRPWQHVLDCLSGYLVLCEALLNGKQEHATEFNFGPEPASNVSVRALLEGLKCHWPEVRWRVGEHSSEKHEASFLYLDSARARAKLGWRPKWSLDQALKATAEWYTAVLASADTAQEVTHRQIAQYLERTVDQDQDLHFRSGRYNRTS